MSLIDQITPVVVTYNSAELYDRLVETLSIFKHFIIVDNDSNKSDDLIFKLKKTFPNQLYISSNNIGYGPGNNLGISFVQTEFALILNPDVKIEREAVISMLACADKFPNALAIGAQVFDEKQNKKVVSYNWSWPAHPIDINPEGDLSAKFLPGCCLLLRIPLFLRIGGFDNDLFMYYEEYDLCHRAIKAGFDCVLAYQAVCSHAPHSSSKPSIRADYLKSRHWYRSKRIFAQKNGFLKISYLDRAAMIIINFLLAILMLSLFQIRRAIKYLARFHGAIY
jgi:N-acetylglucosaminyl-diphospho-decaprenol L-rhamnosyltransferase